MIYIGTVPLDNHIPKICVPLVGRTVEELQAACRHIQQAVFDIVEFRVDFLGDVLQEGAAMAALQAVRQMLPHCPLLFTFRTKAEGGETAISDDAYAALLQQAVQSGLIDALDIEYFRCQDDMELVMELAKEKGVTIVMSSHDFQKTPPLEELEQRLLAMKRRGADVAKLACMPQCAADVLTLLQATEHVKSLYPDEPLITMSMGQLGVISRISGEVFGSAMTFGTVGTASAPGQLDAADLRQVLNVLHGKL